MSHPTVSNVFSKYSLVINLTIKMTHKEPSENLDENAEKVTEKTRTLPGDAIAAAKTFNQSSLFD